MVKARIKKVRTVETLKDYTKIVVETDEENPTTIADINCDEIKVANGYRVRLVPNYD